jgi:hypothetical protein
LPGKLERNGQKPVSFIPSAAIAVPLPLSHLPTWAPVAAFFLCLAPLSLWVLALVLPVGERFLRSAWESLLGSQLGKVWWQALAAVLPPLIPVSAFFQGNSTGPERGVTLAGLLLAIALVQLYGRASEQRERTKTAAEREQQRATEAAEREQQQTAAEARLAEQTALLTEQRDRLAEQTALFLALVNEVREGRSEAADGVSSQRDLLFAVVAEVRRLNRRAGT